MKKPREQKELINEQAANYEGSIIMQAIVSHGLSWKVAGGNAQTGEEGAINFDPTSIQTRLHQVDVYPDLSYDSGHAQSTYVVYTSLASLQGLLENFDAWLTNHIANTMTEGQQIAAKTLNYSVSVSTENVVLRGLTDGDTQNPTITFKASTDFVSKFEGDEIDNWNNVRVSIRGDFGKLDLTNESKPGIKDVVDSDGNMIIEQVLPSLILSFHAEQTAAAQEDK